MYVYGEVNKKKVAYPFTTQTEALHHHKEPTWGVSHRE